MNGSNFQIEQQCPQCGAPIILDEADRILSCKFCRTRVYLATKDHFRFYLPPAAGIAENIYFIPYWRIKGLSYTIREKDMNQDRGNQLFSYSIISNIKQLEISDTYVDTNFLSFDAKSLPYSLGLRPQAMKMKFAGNNETKGKFLKPSIASREDVINDYRRRIRGTDRNILIGDTASIIYSPVYFAAGRIYDAILQKPLKLDDEDGEQTFAKAAEEKWHVDFIPMLCPNCGADLPGEKDVLTVFCGNCCSAWNLSDKNFGNVKFSTWEGKTKDVIYLPFWQLKVKIGGLQLETYADLIRLANLLKAPAKEWETIPFYFCSPAFKINPSLYLRWCRQATVTPAPKNLTTDLPEKNIYPVTLSVTEALESSLLTLTALLTDKRPLMPQAPPLIFTMENFSLVLHPFELKGRQMLHAITGFPMDINALNLGAYL